MYLRGINNRSSGLEQMMGEGMKVGGVGLCWLIKKRSL